MGEGFKKHEYVAYSQEDVERETERMMGVMKEYASLMKGAEHDDEIAQRLVAVSRLMELETAASTSDEARKEWDTMRVRFGFQPRNPQGGLFKERADFVTADMPENKAVEKIIQSLLQEKKEEK